MITVQKIISGGQTGVDIGGLVGARRVGIVTGGIAPKGWKTENGPQPILSDYGLKEHPSDSYAARTVENVKAADVTIILSTNPDSDGTKKTIRTARQLDKPHIHLNPFQSTCEKQLVEFINKHKPAIINIAGNRESICPGIGQRAAKVVENVINQLRNLDAITRGHVDDNKVRCD